MKKIFIIIICIILLCTNFVHAESISDSLQKMQELNNRLDGIRDNIVNSSDNLQEGTSNNAKSAIASAEELAKLNKRMEGLNKGLKNIGHEGAGAKAVGIVTGIIIVIGLWIYNRRFFASKRHVHKIGLFV